MESSLESHTQIGEKERRAAREKGRCITTLGPTPYKLWVCNTLQTREVSRTNSSDEKIETFVVGANLARRPCKVRVNLQMSLRTEFEPGQYLDGYVLSETYVSNVDAHYDGLRTYRPLKK